MKHKNLKIILTTTIVVICVFLVFAYFNKQARSIKKIEENPATIKDIIDGKNIKIVYGSEYACTSGKIIYYKGRKMIIFPNQYALEMTDPHTYKIMVHHYILSDGKSEIDFYSANTIDNHSDNRIFNCRVLRTQKKVILY